jgi:hypothetical protein
MWLVWGSREFRTRFLTGNLKGRLGRPGRRYEYNIKMDVKERKREDVDWFYLNQDTRKRDLVNAVMIFWVSYNSEKF